MSLITFKATSKKLPGGLAVENESRGFKLILDEPEDLGGTDTGMNPVEALLCALGSCETIVASCFAKANGHSPSTNGGFELEGDLDTTASSMASPACATASRRSALSCTSKPTPQSKRCSNSRSSSKAAARSATC